MADKEWRPDDWGKYIQKYCHLPCKVREDYKNCVDCRRFGTDILEWGATAMLSALIKWLFEPCTEHPSRFVLDKPILGTANLWSKKPLYETCHYCCPQCMESLKKMEVK
jgi:hypothetical protein